ncbi:unnamed protein product [Auanema sp. JU1783]|nr:unnamed protein product [Auanema sp. JU1783]
MYLAQQANLLSPQNFSTQNNFNNNFNLSKASLSNHSIMNSNTAINSNLTFGQFGQKTFPAVPIAYSEDSVSNLSYPFSKEFHAESKTYFESPSYKNSFSCSGFTVANNSFMDSCAMQNETNNQSMNKRPTPIGVEPQSYQGKHGQEVFARKVFVGGLPIDVSEEEVRQTFKVYGNVIVDWPRRPDGNSRHEEIRRSMTGYVFLVFEEEYSVRKLVDQCHRDNDRYYLFVSSPTMRQKPVQVRPWKLADMEYMLDPSMPLDPRRTVFIGGVPRPTRAKELAECLNNLYGSVCYVGIDIDPELKYPKGAARVTFSTTQAFISAISGRFVHVHHADTQKRVEIKPYIMDDQMCDECQGKKCLSHYAPYFCGDISCLQYFCETCWDQIHLNNKKRADHRPLVRMGDQTKVLPRPPHHNNNNAKVNQAGRQSYFSRNN